MIFIYFGQGGYLQGRLKLPKNSGNLRVVFSTVSDAPLSLDAETLDRCPEAARAHPMIMFIVRKGQHNKSVTLKAKDEKSYIT